MGMKYPKEFRDDVVGVARRGDLPLRQVATDFGVSIGSVHRWVGQANIDEGRKEGVSSEAAEELRASRKRVRVLEQEVEILRRATAYFAKGHAPK